MAKGVEFRGQVVEVAKDLFIVENDAGMKVQARLGGKMRMNKIRVLLGDYVSCQVSEYDLGKGIITSRDQK